MPLDPATVTSPPDATRTGAGEPPPPSSGPPPDAPPGFALDREIGAGGMGVVYLARQQGLNRPVALKTVRPGTTLDPRALIRFLAEAEAVAAVRHPNVVEVYSFGEHAGRPYLALEYCPGGDLTTVSKAEQTRDANWFRRVADLVARIADGVNAAHQLGIVHRDLKPANVLLTADGTPKVTDFGLAKKGLGSDLTHTTDVLGTPAYMAPEQAGGRTKFVGPEADVWALGVMLYELLCGQRPFDAPSPLEVMAAVAKAEVPKLRDRSPTVPADLALVAHKCLSADPRDRYPTAGGLAADLRHWLDGKPVSARPAGVVESAVKWVKRNKRAALTGLAALLVMATATAVSLGFGIDATEQRRKAEEAVKREADEKQAAIDARNDLVKANEKTEKALARAMVARYMNVGTYGMPGYSSDEHKALAWELVDHRVTPLALLVLQEAISYEAPNATLSEEFLHSLVGLNGKRKSDVDLLFINALRNRSLAVASRTRVADGAARAGYCIQWPSELTDAVRDGFQPHETYTPVGFSTSLTALANCAAMAPHRCEELAELAMTQFGVGKTLWFNVEDEFLSLLRLWAGVSPERRMSYSTKLLDHLLTRLEISEAFQMESYGRFILLLASSQYPHRTDELADRLVKRIRDEFNVARTANGRMESAYVGSAVIHRLTASQAARLAEEFVPSLIADAANSDLSAPMMYSIVVSLSSYLPSEQSDGVQQKIIADVSARLKKAKGTNDQDILVPIVVAACRHPDEVKAEQRLRDLFDVASTPYARRAIELGIIRLGPAPGSHEIATRMAQQLADEVLIPGTTSLLDDNTTAIEALCQGLSREELHRRKALPALAGGLVSPDALPKPKPLPPQVLVDLLKRPFVVREKQRAVLNALEVTYDRKFKDLWEFVAFAEKEHPELDLLTPPKRPERK